MKIQMKAKDTEFTRMKSSKVKVPLIKESHSILNAR